MRGRYLAFLRRGRVGRIEFNIVGTMRHGQVHKPVYHGVHLGIFEVLGRHLMICDGSIYSTFRVSSGVERLRGLDLSRGNG